MKKILAQKIFPVSFLCLIFSSCALSENSSKTSSESENLGNQKKQTSYCSESELAERKSAFSILENPDSWKLQYPSGTDEGGMLQAEITEDFKLKYFSLFESENGKKYLRFSLDASDKGKSKNGSSVRAELRSIDEWTMSGRNELSYSFYLTSTNLATAKFTVGQFLQHCSEKDSPLCRIELENGKITAKVTNYEPDGITKSDGKTHQYELGGISQFEEVSIKIALDGKTMNLFRDDELKATHTFSGEVSSKNKNYFKAGIYYQNKDSPEIFTEVFMRNLKVVTE